jgi:hypothetical protein
LALTTAIGSILTQRKRCVCEERQWAVETGSVPSKVIDRQIVIEAMEEAIAKAARSRYGAETDVHAEMRSRRRPGPPGCGGGRR